MEGRVSPAIIKVVVINFVEGYTACGNFIITNSRISNRMFLSRDSNGVSEISSPKQKQFDVSLRITWYSRKLEKIISSDTVSRHIYLY